MNPSPAAMPLRAAALLAAALLAPGASEPTTAAPRDETAFVPAQPGYRYVFPRDHGAHDAYRTEWWYYTGHLHARDGRRFGFELTFFRRGIAAAAVRANPSRWAVKDVYFAHAAVSDVSAGRFRYAEKVSRAGLGKAGADAERLHVWIDRWHAEADAAAAAPHRLKAETAAFALDLTLTPEVGPVVHGTAGVSLKGKDPGQASHYYSFTRMAAAGTLTIEGAAIPVSGRSWMDHEFGSGDLGAHQAGWDWFSLQFAGGGEVMLYLLRTDDGGVDDASSGTVVHPDGRVTALDRKDLRVATLGTWSSARSGARYPAAWRIEIPRAELSAEIHPVLADQELVTDRSTRVTYWEGAVAAHGTWRGRPVTGEGYVELTGYARPYDAGR